MRNHLTTHPGEVLREDVLPGLNMSEADFAAHLGISHEALRAVLRCEAPVTLDLAARLVKALGGSVRYWLAMQMAYDVDVADEIDVKVEPLPHAPSAA